MAVQVQFPAWGPAGVEGGRREPAPLHAEASLTQGRFRGRRRGRRPAAPEPTLTDDDIPVLKPFSTLGRARGAAAPRSGGPTPP